MQECALCLCEHYGRHLSDVIGYSKKGKKITVQMACIRKMNKLINRKTRDRYRNISFEALTRKSEPTVEMKEEVKQDYEQCDKIVDSLNLTDNMRIALECRMAGLSYPEIGRILERAQATVWCFPVSISGVENHPNYKIVFSLNDERKGFLKSKILFIVK